MEEKVKAPTLRSSSLKRTAQNNSAVAILAVLWVVCLLFANGFSKSLYQVFREGSVYGLIAVGLALVMITGNIDLSVGFQAGLCALVTVLVGNATGNVVLAVIVALAAGAACGLVNGFVVTRIGVSPLIATIATNYIYKGLVYFKTMDGSVKAEDALKTPTRSWYRDNLLEVSKISTITVLAVLVVLILLGVVLYKTRFGNSLYIVGDNAEAGRFAGIRVPNVSHLAYVLCGVCCGLAGVFMVAKDGMAVYTQGDGKDVFAISCCILGGIKMSGGKGTMFNVLIGILVMRSITTLLSVIGASSSYQDLVSGLLLIVVLIIDRVSRWKEGD